MLRVSQLKLPVEHKEADLKNKLCRLLRIKPQELTDYHIVRRSIDARKKPDIYYVYTIDAETTKEEKILANRKLTNVARAKEAEYQFPAPGRQEMTERPVIVGSGPAGLFCAYMLASHGYRPILLEMGEEAAVRKQKIDSFWAGNALDKKCNVQFGEGGAGTFSDGKLNTSVKDRSGRNHKVLELFVKAGAPEKILYEAKPHLGTDQLIIIVQNLRNSIIAMGGEVHFRAKVTDLHIKKGEIQAVETEDGRIFHTHTLVLAVGHSSRDTFGLLYRRGMHMMAKPFAVGVRVVHPQAVINQSQYGIAKHAVLGAADYRLAHTVDTGRGVYSFCMCPGGYVVNASSEEEMTAVNGMSYSGRDSAYANSAIVVTVTPEDYMQKADSSMPDELQGIAFQRNLEGAAFRNGQGQVPVQRFADFCRQEKSTGIAYGDFMKGNYHPSLINDIFPAEITASLQQGIRWFDRQIPGFAAGDTVLAGVESRTSSPVKMERNELLESNIRGIYPCGEGAGYAGGITSAAIDGLKVAEEIAKKYMNF